jgi:hypothetical protein
MPERKGCQNPSQPQGAFGLYCLALVPLEGRREHGSGALAGAYPLRSFGCDDAHDGLGPAHGGNRGFHR